MLDKIKKAMTYIVLPLTLLGGFIFYLLQRITTLKSKVAEGQATQTITKILTEIEEEKKNADQKETDYHNVIDEYRKQRDGGGQDST